MRRNDRDASRIFGGDTFHITVGRYNAAAKSIEKGITRYEILVYAEEKYDLAIQYMRIAESELVIESRMFIGIIANKYFSIRVISIKRIYVYNRDEVKRTFL